MSAAAEQRLYINGELAEGKVVTEITFLGDNVTLIYEGGTSEIFDMSAIVLDFEKETNVCNGVKMVKLHTMVDNVLTISGTQNGDSVDIYNLSGQKVVSVKAVADETIISVAALTSGIYMMRTNNYVVKFIKK